MRTAILYSGGIRSFDKCLPNHAWMIHRHFPGADFYCATVSDADTHKVNCLKQWNGLEIHDKQPDFPLPPRCPAQWTPGKYYSHEPYFISVSPAAIIGQLWQLQNVWNLIPDGKEYDCYIRIRPDIWFHEFEKPFKKYEDMGANVWPVPVMAFTPYFGRFGGCNDRFAILGAKAAEAYFNTYSLMNRLIADGCPLHPESLIKAALESEGCVINDQLNAVFSTLRTSGEMRQPEISAVDIAHKRG